MSRAQLTILTNICMIEDLEKQRVVMQYRSPESNRWSGYAFPGGHVEKGEALIPSTIREIKEETGLDISNLKLCGIKDWFEPKKNRRYMVFLYSTTTFSGELINETDEGKVFWQNINQLTDLKLASSFAEMAEMMLRSSYSEFIYEIDGDTWKKKFY